MSIATVRRMEGVTLHPAKDETGAHRFDSREVATVASARSTRAITCGEIAARACELFRDGKGVTDVVIELRQPFDVVQPLFHAFLEDSGGLAIPGPIAREIEGEFGDGLDRISAGDLLQRVRALAQRATILSGRLAAAESTLRSQDRAGALLLPGSVVRELEHSCQDSLRGAKLTAEELPRILRERLAKRYTSP